jgi:hypothetical protein
MDAHAPSASGRNKQPGFAAASELKPAPERVMKISKSFIVAVAIILAVGGYYQSRLNEMNRIDNPANMTTPEGEGPMLDRVMQWRESHGKPAIPPTWETNPPPQPNLNRPPHDLGVRQKANEISKSEIIQIAPRRVVECSDSFGESSNQVSGAETNRCRKH